MTNTPLQEQHRSDQIHMKKNLSDIKLWTALITPFSEDGSIDWKSLELLLKQQNLAGLGMVLFGSTGEGFSLTRDEKIQILDFVYSFNLSVPIIVNGESGSQNQVLEFIEMMNNWPIDGIMAVQPPYMKPGVNGQIEWFKSILDVSKKPVLVYNHPGRTGSKISPEVLLAIKDNENYLGLKDSGNDWSMMLEYHLAAKEKAIYCGDDANISTWSNGPISGLISVASNAWPFEVKEFVDKSFSNTLSMQEIIAMNQLCSSLFKSSNPIGIKNYMFVKQQINTPFCRAPLSTLDSNSLDHEDHKGYFHWEKEVGQNNLYRQ